MMPTLLKRILENIFLLSEKTAIFPVAYRCPNIFLAKNRPIYADFHMGFSTDHLTDILLMI